MMAEFDEEQRVKVHSFVDELLHPRTVIKIPAMSLYGIVGTANLSKRVYPEPVIKEKEAAPLPPAILEFEKACAESGVQDIVGTVGVETAEALKGNLAHHWITIVKGVPLQRRCDRCRCLLTVFKSGVASYQMPFGDVTTRRPECKP